MKFIKTYLPLIVGGAILFTANTESHKLPYLYILGIVLVMFGLYNISRGIKGKEDNQDDIQ